MSEYRIPFHDDDGVPTSEKDSIEARAEALASEYFGPEFDGSHLTRKEAFVAGYKVCRQELDRQASSPAVPSEAVEEAIEDKFRELYEHPSYLDDEKALEFWRFYQTLSLDQTAALDKKENDNGTERKQ